MPNPRDYNYEVTGTGETWNNVTNNTKSYSMSIYAGSRRVSTDYGKRRKPQGWVPPTNYSAEFTRWRGPTGTIDTTSGSQMIRWDRGAMSNWAHSSIQTAIELEGSFPSDLADRALTKARLKLKGTDVNLAQAYAERRMTARLVGDNLSRIGKGLNVLKEGAKRISASGHNPEKTARDLSRYLKRFVPARILKTGYLIRDIPNIWLELQYGWKPLLSDIHGAVDALDKRDRDDWMVTVKGRATSRKDVNYETPPGQEYLDRFSLKGSVLHGVYVRIDARPSIDSLRTAASLGLTNPLNLAWELLPFSFVVDWAYPLGSYFDQLDAIAGWEVRGYSSSCLTKTRIEAKGVSGPVSGQPWYDRADWYGYYRHTRLNRTAGSTVPFPMLPSIKDPFSQTHVANGLSLLYGAVSGILNVR